MCCKSQAQQEGDLCTCRGPEFPESFGSPGHLKMHQGKLVCVPDERRSSELPDPASDRRSVEQRVADHARVMADAYADYDLRVAQQYRDPT
jgi:hypothetical protein